MAVAGRMPHPFQLPAVKTGNDLITFFKEDAVNYLFQEDPNKKGATVKIDGINLAIKVVGDVDGKRMAFDPGSLNPLDVQGLTADNVGQRYKEGHGLIGISTQVIDVFETVLSDIQRELEILGLWNDPSYYLNLEYVKSGKSNIIGYEGVSTNFLVLHNISQFYEKVTSDPTKMSRSGAERPLVLNPKKGVEEPTKAKSRIVELSDTQRNALDSLIQKVNEANSDFQVYTSFPVQQKQADRASIIKNIDSALNSSFPIEITKSPEQFSEDQMNYFNDLLCGTLEDCLRRAVNPIGQSVKTIQYGTVPVEKKDLYFDIIIEGKAIDEIISVGNPDAGAHAKMLIDMAAIWHATRLLGNAILPAFTSELGDVENHEGIVLYDKERFGVPEVKIVGEFLVDVVLYSPFSKRYKGPKQLKEGMAGSETIVLFPGAFKPPHKGYLETIRDIGIGWDKLYMIIGTGGTKTKTVGGEKIKIPKRTIHGEAITSDVSKTLFRKYFEDAGIGNYSLIDIKQGEQHFYVDKNGNEKSMTATPLTKVLDIIKGGEAGQTYVLLTIDEEAGRFKYILESQKDKIPEGVEIVVKEIEKQPEEDLGQVLHGTELRAAIESGDLETFKKYVPETSLRDAEQIFAYLGGKKKVSEQILDTVESLLAELDYQKQSKRIKTHAKRRNKLVGRGKQKPGPPYTKKPPKKRSKSGPPGFAAAEEAIENEDAEILDEEAIEETSSMAAGNVAGYAGGIGDEDDEDDKKPSLIREEPKDDTKITKEGLLRLVEQELEEIDDDFDFEEWERKTNPFADLPKPELPLKRREWTPSQQEPVNPYMGWTPRMPHPITRGEYLDPSKFGADDPIDLIDWESFRKDTALGDISPDLKADPAGTYKGYYLRNPVTGERDFSKPAPRTKSSGEASEFKIIDNIRSDIFDSYSSPTKGANYRAWVDRVGKEKYETEILPQIQYLLRNVDVSYNPNLRGTDAMAFSGNEIQFGTKGFEQLQSKAPEVKREIHDTFAHELSHIIDQNFEYNLSRQQAPLLKQLIDPVKLRSREFTRPTGDPPTYIRKMVSPELGKHIVKPQETRGYALGLRDRLEQTTGRTKFTADDVQTLCTVRSPSRRGHPLHGKVVELDPLGGAMNPALNCGTPEKNQSTADILNKIVKVDQPSQTARIAESNNKLVINKSKLKKIIEEEMSATALAASGGIINDVANMLRDLFLNYAVQMRQETGQELEARQLQKQQQDMIAAQQQTIEDKKEDEEDTMQRNRWSAAAALGRARKGLTENKEDKEFIDDVMSYLLKKPGVNLND